MLLLSLSGCAGLTSRRAAQWLDTSLSVLDAGAEAYFARHPNADAEAELARALLGARAAAAAYHAAVAVQDDAGAASAWVALLDAYSAAREAADALGVLDARPPDGGAETSAPEPEPLDVPTAAELDAP